MRIGFNQFAACFRFIFCVFLFSGTVAMANDVGVVTKHAKREKILNRVKTVLDNENQELRLKFSEIVYPFAFEKEEVEKPPPIVVDKTKNKPPPAPIKVVKVTDEQVLQRIAASIKPIGVMEMGGKGVMSLRNGRLEEGGTIKVNVQNKPRIIFVEKITRSSFVLRLNDATFEQPIKEISTQNKISKDPLPGNPENTN